MKKTRYAHYNINYHLVWIPKYRKRILVGTIKEDLEIAIHEIADKMEVEIESLEVQSDHIHLFLSSPPRYAPAKLINAFKGATSHRLRNKYPHLKSLPSMWTKTYYVGTAGNVSAEVIKRYIEECQGT
ncbi:MAG: IS200/IS605 family transposase [Methanotrichaceae archaeon]